MRPAQWRSHPHHVLLLINAMQQNPLLTAQLLYASVPGLAIHYTVKQLYSKMRSIRGSLDEERAKAELKLRRLAVSLQSRVDDFSVAPVVHRRLIAPTRPNNHSASESVTRTRCGSKKRERDRLFDEYDVPYSSSCSYYADPSVPKHPTEFFAPPNKKFMPLPIDSLVSELSQCQPEAVQITPEIDSNEPNRNEDLPSAQKYNSLASFQFLWNQCGNESCDLVIALPSSKAMPKVAIDCGARMFHIDQDGAPCNANFAAYPYAHMQLSHYQSVFPIPMEIDLEIAPRRHERLEGNRPIIWYSFTLRKSEQPRCQA